jgi:hypothetical protein
MEGNTVPVNYLSKSLPVKLKLIHGDGDTFSDVLGLINEYEGKSAHLVTSSSLYLVQTGH